MCSPVSQTAPVSTFSLDTASSSNEFSNLVSNSATCMGLTLGNPSNIATTLTAMSQNQTGCRCRMTKKTSPERILKPLVNLSPKKTRGADRTKQRPGCSYVWIEITVYFKGRHEMLSGYWRPLIIWIVFGDISFHGNILNTLALLNGLGVCLLGF